MGIEVKDPAVREMADRIIAAKTMPYAGKGVIDDKGAFENELPHHDLTLETVDKVDKTRSTFVAASLLVASETAADAMEKDPELSIVSFSGNVGKHATVDHSIYRSSEERDTRMNPDTKKFEVVGTKTVYGQTDTKFVVKGGANSKGVLKSTRTAVSDYFTPKFGKK